MGKNAIISYAMIAVIVLVCAYSAFGIVAADSVIFNLSDYEEFRYFYLVNPGTVQACSTLPLPASISGASIIATYGEEALGEMRVGQFHLAPGSYAEPDAVFVSLEPSSVQYILLAMDSQGAGTSPVRIDPSVFSVQTHVKTSIFGIIPYTVQTTYPEYQFVEMMNSGKGC